MRSINLNIQREEFFQVCSPFFMGRDLALIARAYQFSKHGHYKQLREDGTPYKYHPRSVALIILNFFGVIDRDSIIAALLHDIQEDSFLLTEECLRVNFGQRPSRLVWLLTKTTANKKFYYKRLVHEGNWRALLIKVADRLHNLMTLASCDREKQRRQVIETCEQFPALLDALPTCIPRKHRHVVSMARDEIDKLCIHYA